MENKNRDAEYEHLAQEALKNYRITVKRAELIRHNKNVTFGIFADEGRFTLRIHKPRDGFSLGVLTADITPCELFENEMSLLRYIADNSRLNVQKPIKTVNGYYICDADGYPACLLSWIDGAVLTKENGNEYAAQLGQLAARLHNAVNGFQGKRYTYSHALLKKLRAEIKKAKDMGHISAGQTAVIIGALLHIDDVMTRLDAVPGAHCLIHSDMNYGNILVTEHGLAPIDFSLSGYGYRAIECGMLASCLSSDEAIEAMRRAYCEESGTTVSRYDTDAFFALSVILFIACQHNLFYKDEWFINAMKRWTSGCLSPTRWTVDL